MRTRIVALPACVRLPRMFSVPFRTSTTPSLSSGGSIRAVPVAVVRSSRPVPVLLIWPTVPTVKMIVLLSSRSVPALFNTRRFANDTLPPVCTNVAPANTFVTPAGTTLPPSIVPPDQVKVAPLGMFKVPVPPSVPALNVFAPEAVAAAPAATFTVPPASDTWPSSRAPFASAVVPDVTVISPPAAAAPKSPSELPTPLPPSRLSVPLSACTTPSLSSGGSIRAVPVAVVRSSRPVLLIWPTVPTVKMIVLLSSRSVPALFNTRRFANDTLPPVCTNVAPANTFVTPAGTTLPPSIVPPDQVKVAPLGMFKVPVPPSVPALNVFAPEAVAVAPAATFAVPPASDTWPSSRAPFASAVVPDVTVISPPAAAAPKSPSELPTPLPPSRLSVPLSACTTPSLSSGGSIRAVPVAVVRSSRPVPVLLIWPTVPTVKMIVLLSSRSVPALFNTRRFANDTLPPVCTNVAPANTFVTPAGPVVPPSMVPADQTLLPDRSSRPEPPSVPPLNVKSAAVETSALLVRFSVPPLRISLPAAWRERIESVPVEWVTVVPAGMQAWSVAVGRASVLQCAVSSHAPAAGPTQLTVQFAAPDMRGMAAITARKAASRRAMYRRVMLGWRDR